MPFPVHSSRIWLFGFRVKGHGRHVLYRSLSVSLREYVCGTNMCLEQMKTGGGSGSAWGPVCRSAEWGACCSSWEIIDKSETMTRDSTRVRSEKSSQFHSPYFFRERYEQPRIDLGFTTCKTAELKMSYQRAARKWIE